MVVFLCFVIVIACATPWPPYTDGKAGRRAEVMARGVKHLLCSHESLTLIPQNLGKNQYVNLWWQSPYSEMGRGTRESPEAGRLIRLLDMMKSKGTLPQRRPKVRPNTWGCPLTFTHVSWSVHLPTPSPSPTLTPSFKETKKGRKSRIMLLLWIGEETTPK